MKTSIQILPGVKAIGWLDCSKLTPHVDLAGICGMSVAILTDVHPIHCFVEPQCECKSKKENGGYEDSASLKFITDKHLPEGVILGFVVTDANDCTYLIGSKERPVPVVTTERRIGKPDGEAAGWLYEVTHVAIKSLIPCKIGNTNDI